MNKGQILTVYFLIALVACSPKSSDQAEASQTEPEPAPEEQVAESLGPGEEVTDARSPQVHSWFTAREPGDEEIREYGIITEMEDSPYPMFNISVSFPEREMSASFSLNAEGASLSHNIGDFLDQYASIYYEIKESNHVADIIFNDQSLLGEYALEDYEGFERFEGILRGADSESGDLPGTLTIEGDNENFEFDYFVDSVLMEVNNQKIMVYYFERVDSEITYMELSTD